MMSRAMDRAGGLPAVKTRGPRLDRALGVLARSVVVAAALVAVMVASAAPWALPSACQTGPACLASLSDRQERIGDDAAIVALLNEVQDEDSFGPTHVPALARNSPPRISGVQTPPYALAAVGTRRAWLPDKTGPPRR